MDHGQAVDREFAGNLVCDFAHEFLGHGNVAVVLECGDDLSMRVISYQAGERADRAVFRVGDEGFDLGDGEGVGADGDVGGDWHGCRERAGSA